MVGYTRRSILVVAVAIALLASACAASAGDSSPTSTSSPVSAAVPSAPPTPSASATPGAMPTADGDTGLGAGTYAFDFTRLDAPGKPFPRTLITVPDGWSGFRGFGVDSLSGPRYHFVSFWDVVDVYTNSCHWLGPKVHSGPTVDELAAVLAARPLRNATLPVAFSLGGHDGKYLEWSVPDGIAFSDCDKDPQRRPVLLRELDRRRALERAVGPGGDDGSLPAGSRPGRSTLDPRRRGAATRDRRFVYARRDRPGQGGHAAGRRLHPVRTMTGHSVRTLGFHGWLILVRSVFPSSRRMSASFRV